MTTLLLAELQGTALADVTAKALTAARAMGAPVHVLVAGEGVGAVVEAAATSEGVEKVLVAETSKAGAAACSANQPGWRGVVLLRVLAPPEGAQSATGEDGRRAGGRSVQVPSRTFADKPTVSDSVGWG